MKLKRLLVLSLAVAMSLCACGKADDSADATYVFEQTEGITEVETMESDFGEVPESTAESEEVESSEEFTSAEEVAGGSETVDGESGQESGEESVVPTEETKAATEGTDEAMGESQEAARPSWEQESTAPTKEETKSSVEQIPPSQEASKPSTSAPSVEQTAPSAPAVHTCNYGSGSVTKAATCKEEGVKTYTCSCGASKTESIGKKSHNYVTDSKVASCTEAGYEKTACSICGDVQSEKTIAATGHNLQENWLPQGPTCTYAGGMHWENCTKCDYKADLPAGTPLGHNPDAGTELHGGTCTRKNLLAYHCTRCGSKMYEAEGSTVPDNHYWCYDEEEQEWYCAYGCGTTK